jgi:hypothetical protein
MESPRFQRAKVLTLICVWATVWMLLICGVPLTLATIAKAMYNAAFDDFKGEGQTFSESIEEAKLRGTFVCELQPQPQEMTIEGTTVKFQEAWIEERALLTHCFVWFPCNRRIGGYSLCFTLQNGADLKDAPKGFFVANDDEIGFERSISANRPALYCYEMESTNVSQIKVSFLSSRKDKRLRNIVFVQK